MSLQPADTARPHLTLYMRDFCMYCNRVLRVIDELGINVEVRNIWDARDNEKELFENTGQRSVPVLRITSGEDEIWMPESSDIIRYLESQVADKPEN